MSELTKEQCYAEAVKEISQLTIELAQLRSDLNNPPPDVQEKVIQILNLVSDDALKAVEKERDELKAKLDFEFYNVAGLNSLCDWANKQLDEMCTRAEQAEARVLEWENREASVCPEDTAFENVIGDLRAKLEQSERRECAVRRELVAHREKAQGNYWAWDETDENDVNSLVCPVLIHTGPLLEILNRKEQSDAKVAEMRALLELVWEDNPRFEHALSTDCGKPLLARVKRLEEALEKIQSIDYSRAAVNCAGYDAHKIAKQALAETKASK